MLVKILLICSSPPNGDNKTLLSAVFISFFCPPPARFPLSGKKKYANEGFKFHLFISFKFISKQKD